MMMDHIDRSVTMHRPRLRAPVAALCALCACTGATERIDIDQPAAALGHPRTAPAAAPAADPGGPPPASTRRLTRQEYVNSILDVLTLDLSSEAEALPLGLPVAGFRNTPTGLHATENTIEVFERLAETAARRVDSNLPARFSPCTEMQPACQEAFVRNLGLALFRRPLDAEQIAAFATLFDPETTAGSFDGGARLVVQAMLQSPEFLYRLEPLAPSSEVVDREVVDREMVDRNSVDDFALASRLSFLFWSSAPDAELLDAATTGQLGSPDVFANQTKRMIWNWRTRRATRQYAEEWLGLDALDSLQRSPARFPAWNRDLAAALKTETLAFTDRVLFDPGATLRDLFTDRRTDVTQVVAQTYYDVAEPFEGQKSLPLTNYSDRMGLLTLPGILAAHAVGESGSIVDRGVFLARAFLCQDLAPPEDQNVTLADIPAVGERARLALHRSSPACAGCHNIIDPLGFPFERFDAAGAFRTEDENGLPLSAAGTVTLDHRAQNYVGAPAFMRLLAESPEVQRCMLERAFQYALGRPLGPDDRESLVGVELRMRVRGETWTTLLVSIAQATAFRLQAELP